MELGTGCSLTSISETEKKKQEKTTSRSTRFMTQTHPDEEAEKKSLNPPNGVGMRFESLILHADGFFSLFVQLTNMTCLTV